MAKYVNVNFIPAPACENREGGEKTLRENQRTPLQAAHDAADDLQRLFCSMAARAETSQGFKLLRIAHAAADIIPDMNRLCTDENWLREKHHEAFRIVRRLCACASRSGPLMPLYMKEICRILQAATKL